MRWPWGLTGADPAESGTSPAHVLPLSAYRIFLPVLWRDPLTDEIHGEGPADAALDEAADDLLRLAIAQIGGEVRRHLESELGRAGQLHLVVAHAVHRRFAEHTLSPILLLLPALLMLALGLVRRRRSSLWLLATIFPAAGWTLSWASWWP